MFNDALMTTLVAESRIGRALYRDLFSRRGSSTVEFACLLSGKLSCFGLDLDPPL